MSKPRLVPSEVTLASVDDYTAFVKHPAIPASYTILKEDSTYYALPCFSGGTKYKGDNAAVVLQAAHNALPTDGTGGVIYVKDGIDTGATVIVINRACTIKTDRRNATNQSYRPIINRIRLDAVDRLLNGVVLDGFKIADLDLYAQTHQILGLTGKHLLFQPSNTYSSGIKMRGDSYGCHMNFEDCTMYDYVSNGKGAINFSSTSGGWGQIVFSRLLYMTKANNNIFFVNDSTWWASFAIIWDNCFWVYSDSKTGCKTFLMKTDSQCSLINLDNPWLEYAETATFAEIEAKTTANRMKFNMQISKPMVSVDVNKTLTFLNNLNDNFYAHNNGLFLEGGVLYLATNAVFNLGTLAQQQYFKVRIKNWRGFEMEQKAYPINDVAVVQSVTANTYGSYVDYDPTAGMNYFMVFPYTIGMAVGSIGTETITVELTTVHSDGTSSVSTVARNTDGATHWTAAELMTHLAAKHITKLRFRAKSSISSSTAAVTIRAYIQEL